VQNNIKLKTLTYVRVFKVNGGKGAKMKLKKKTLILFITMLSISLSLSGCVGENTNEPLSKTEYLMDTVITIKIYDKKDEKILDLAFDRLNEIENRMSNTISDSDISIVNQNAGIKPVTVHDDVYYVLGKAKYFAEISNGAYDPTIGPLVDLWDISRKSKERNKEGSKEIPSDSEIKKSRGKVDYKKLDLLEGNQVFLKEKDMKLDLGGIAKGFAADEVKKIMIDNGVNSAILDLGGNVYAVGEKNGGEYWNIGVQNPFSTQGDNIGILKVKDSSIVTSGDYERYFEVNGKRYHHIIDSKTGYPSENELTGVSIISKKSIDGDALSTTLFVLGIKDGTKLLKQLEDVDAIFITKNGEVYISKELQKSFELTNKSLKLKINEF
jgi:thiamine biosynthesis lipoprotein